MDKNRHLQGLLGLVRSHFCGNNAAELGRRLDKDGSYINRLFYPPGKRGGKGIGPEITEKATKAFGLPRGFWEMSVEEASVAIGASQQVSKEETSDVVIRQYETGGSMGRGIVLQEQPGVIKEWRVTEDWVRLNVHRITAPKNLAIVTGFGPSMQPLFNPGDPLLVDRGITRADIDGVYFFRVGDEGFVKQLQRIPTAAGLVLRAKSYNPLYDSFDITSGMDFEVFARVVKVWRGEEF